MTDVCKKLNLKDHPQVLIIDAPTSFEDQIAELESARVIRSFGKAKTVEFLLAFVTKRSTIKRIASQIAKKALGDAVI